MRALTSLVLLFAAMYFVVSTFAEETTTRFRISEVVEMKSPDTESFRASEFPEAETIYVSKKPILVGTDVASFLPQADDEDIKSVLITLTKGGTEKFRAATTQHLGKQLAIILDGKLVAAPVVQAPIEDGQVVISGRFTDEWLVDMATYFKGLSK